MLLWLSYCFRCRISSIPWYCTIVKNMFNCTKYITTNYRQKTTLRETTTSFYSDGKNNTNITAITGLLADYSFHRPQYLNRQSGHTSDLSIKPLALSVLMGVWIVFFEIDRNVALQISYSRSTIQLQSLLITW